MNVFVTGASGYVGARLVQYLQHAGHHVIALQRPLTRRPIRNPQISLIEGDIWDERALAAGSKQADVLVHLVGIIREIPRAGITMHRVHVEGTARVIRAAERQGIQKLIYVSALGASQQSRSKYQRSKWEAEQLVRHAGIPYTIFQPSVVFGKGGDGPEFVGQLTRLVKKSPFVPIIGDGGFELQPVSIDTVCHAITSAIHNAATDHKTYQLGGPDAVSYLDILNAIAKTEGKSFRPIHIPVFLMKTLVPLLQRIPAFPLTQDQLHMLLSGNTCTDGETVYEALGLNKVPFIVQNRVNGQQPATPAATRGALSGTQTPAAPTRKRTAPSFDTYVNVIDQIITEHRQQGGFDDLKDKGKPIQLDDTGQGEYMVHKIMKNANVLPAWLELQHEIRDQIADLLAARTSSARDLQETEITHINMKIKLYNKQCPSPLLQKSLLTPSNLTQQYSQWQ